MDFERMWQDKLSARLEELKGTEFRDMVMTDSEILNLNSSPSEIIEWTVAAVEKMQEGLSSDELHDVVTGCACHYPQAKLLPIRDAFRKSGSIGECISLLEKQFVESLSDGMHVDQELIEKLIEINMGLPGVLDGNRIIATKIPKSCNLKKWFYEKDPEERRKIYCHCPRVNQALILGMQMPVEYCLCGAGFYRDVWETITEAPLRVEIIESVFAGDDFCRVSVFPSVLQG